MESAERPAPALLLDSPSLIYRAFFAIPRSITGPDGAAVNAVRGYLDMVTRLIGDWRPRDVVSVLDADWRPAWRVAAYPGYKAARPPDPPELPGQFPVIGAVLDAAGLAVVGAPGYEADDVLGSLAVRASTAAPAAIVTGDRDLLQLVRDPAVVVLFTVKGVGTLERFDAQAVRRRYGVEPAQYVDLAILRGDPSDDLPGVPGIGPKRAAELIAAYGGIDGVQAARHRLAPRVAAAVRESAGYLAAMRRIVPVVTDLPVTVPARRPADHHRLAELAEQHGITGPVQRLEAALELLGPPAG